MYKFINIVFLLFNILYSLDESMCVQFDCSLIKLINNFVVDKIRLNIVPNRTSAKCYVYTPFVPCQLTAAKLLFVLPSPAKRSSINGTYLFRQAMLFSLNRLHVVPVN